ncbi:MAG: hypothetical protein QOJ12_3488, partial [Thermoleophilales bacterium]|nr:hypothetical protein [Thermoleophilales bacterium]
MVQEEGDLSSSLSYECKTIAGLGSKHITLSWFQFALL